MTDQTIFELKTSRAGLSPWFSFPTSNPTGFSFTPSLMVKVDAVPLFGREIGEAVNWLQHRILINSQYNHRDESIRGTTHRFTLLYSPLLQKTIGQRLYRKVMNAAVGSIIERSFYDEGKSYGYRIVEPHVTKPTFFVEPQGKRLRKRIIKERKGDVYHKLHDKTLRALLGWLGQTSITLDDMAMIQDEYYRQHQAKGGACNRMICNDYVATQLLALKERHYRFGRDDLGRIHTNVTNLVKPARARLTINGQRLVELDIANSQLVFMTLLLLKAHKPTTYFGRVQGHDTHSNVFEEGIQKKVAQAWVKGRSLISPMSTSSVSFLKAVSQILFASGERQGEARGLMLCKLTQDTVLQWFNPSRMFKPKGMPQDIERWVNLVQSGGIYAELMRLISWDETRRDEFKADELFSVVYGDPTNYGWRKSGQRLLPPSVLKPKLAEAFPNVWAFLVFYHNRHGLGGLAREMQRYESKLMIEGVCGWLIKNRPEIPLLTIHDSIMTTPDYVDTVKGKIVEGFNKLGLQVVVKTK